MYCPNCGTRVESRALYCRNCGGKLGETLERPDTTTAGRGAGLGAPPVQEIPNYLAQAILVTIFCCLPFGIVSIVYAAQVNGKAAAGDVRGAWDASEKAKMWAWVALGCGLIPVAFVSFGLCGSFI